MRVALLALAGLFLAPGALAQGVCTNGTATLDGVNYPCDRVDVLSRVGPVGINAGPFRAPRLNDIWGWTDPDNGDEYALVGTTRGTVFVDVSVPEAPRVLGRIAATNAASEDYSTWRDIKVYQDHAFIVADGTSFSHGMQVFDLTRLRGLSEDPSRDIEPDVLYEAVFSAHNIVINEDTGFAYAVGGRFTPGSGIPNSCVGAGFHAIDISDPLNPTFAGCFSDAGEDTSPVVAPGYTHDAQCVVYDGPDTDYTGQEICFAANEDVVTIFDATDKANAVTISQAAYPQWAYMHQGWLTEDRRHFIANDELDESNGFVATQRSLVFNVEDLDNPEFEFAYDSGITSIDHNLYIRGGLSYQSNYEAGLRIVDVSDVASGTMTEVAFFDTFPQRTQISGGGQWSNYPYFASGIVIASDQNNGLFVLRPDPALLVDSGATPAPSASALSLPRPNPTAGTSELTLSVDAAQTVRAEVFDVSGRRVATLFDGAAAPGADVTLTVEGASLPAGVYLVRVQGETFDAAQRLTIAR